MKTAELARAIIARMARIERKNVDREASPDYEQLFDAVLAEIRDACPTLDYDRLLSPETPNALVG